MAETTGADELATLRAEAEAAGVKVDGRWGADRLRSEIEAAQPGAGESDPSESMDDDEPADGDELTDEETAAALEDEREPAPVVRRAGGWVDRGDGRGWELEE